MLRSEEWVDKRPAKVIPAAEVYERAILDPHPDVEVLPEDCHFTDKEEERLIDTTHPVTAYIGYGALQRVMLAEENALRRQAATEATAEHAGRNVLMLVGAEAA